LDSGEGGGYWVGKGAREGWIKVINKAKKKKEKKRKERKGKERKQKVTFLSPLASPWSPRGPLMSLQIR
jgi:hypothetical protein